MADTDEHSKEVMNDKTTINGEATTTSDQGASKEESPTPPMEKHQKLIFGGVALCYTTCMLSFSILAPFFPVEAAKKGVSNTQIGLIFGIFNLVNFLSAGFFGKYLPVIGAKFMFLSGVWVAGGCNILFGVLDEIEDKQTFLIYCYVIRSVEALGTSATLTASMTIVANTFPDRVAQMTGMLEFFSGAAFMIGPPLGAFFYHLGGYKLPFMVLGGIAVLSIFINMLLLPSVGIDQNKPGSLKKMFQIPAVYPASFGIIVGSASISFLDPTLSLHLNEKFGISPAMVGVYYLIIGGVYGATQPLWGYIADKKKTTRWMMVCGFYLACIGYLAIGPTPIFKVPEEYQEVTVIISLGFIAASLGMSIMPIFLDYYIEAKWYGLPEDLATQGIISGMFNMFLSLGAFIGPTAGGILVDNIGFDWASTVIGGSNLIVMMVVGIFSIWEFRCGYGRRPPWKNLGEGSASSTEEEHRPLIVETDTVESVNKPTSIQ